MKREPMRAYVTIVSVDICSMDTGHLPLSAFTDGRLSASRRVRYERFYCTHCLTSSLCRSDDT